MLGAGTCRGRIGNRIRPDDAGGSALAPMTSTPPPRRAQWSTVAVGAGAVAVAVALALAPSTAVPPPPPAHGPLGAADGVVTGGVAVDDDLPAVTRLDPALLAALRRAAAGAAGDGVRLVVTSGWRSPAYQDLLRREAVAFHGTEAVAARWVATAETSSHVSGAAVDVGPHAAVDWLSEHGAAHGLCRVYANEPWHHELRPDAVDHGCPPPYPDPTHDPRTQR